MSTAFGWRGCVAGRAPGYKSLRRQASQDETRRTGLLISGVAQARLSQCLRHVTFSLNLQASDILATSNTNDRSPLRTQPPRSKFPGWERRDVSDFEDPERITRSRNRRNKSVAAGPKPVIMFHRVAIAENIPSPAHVSLHRHLISRLARKVRDIYYCSSPLIHPRVLSSSS